MILKTINVNAETANFYEAEYIDNIYMSKYQYSNNTIYYQKARFFRKSDTGEAAYCIEPFNFFNEYSTYESTMDPYNLSEEQKITIKQKELDEITKKFDVYKAKMESLLISQLEMLKEVNHDD